MGFLDLKTKKRPRTQNRHPEAIKASSEACHIPFLPPATVSLVATAGNRSSPASEDPFLGDAGVSTVVVAQEPSHSDCGALAVVVHVDLGLREPQGVAATSPMPLQETYLHYEMGH